MTTQDGLDCHVKFNEDLHLSHRKCYLHWPSSARPLLALAWDNHRLRDLKGLHDLLAENKGPVGTGPAAHEVGDRTSRGQGAGPHLPVVVTQSYDSLIPDLGVLINALIFFTNINRFCLKDKRFQRLSNQKQAKQHR